jgi:NADP-dependent alcohol dehydrogenase
MEQYMTTPGQSRLMDRWAESILQTLIEIALKFVKNKTIISCYGRFYAFCYHGLERFIAMGVSQDWGTNMIGHELTALHGLSHGHTLAIVYPATLGFKRR